MKKLLLLLIAVSFINCGGGNDDDMGPPEVIPEIESIPEITTKALVGITANSAYSGGNISSNGNNSIFRKGVCWSKTSNPSISPGTTSNFSVDGEGVSSYESILDELEPNTTYYVRSYATNGIGTGYGNEISFTTSDDTFPENIFNGSAYLTTQQEVDAFGANNYTHINGDIYIANGSGDVTNLDAFISIRIVQGHFVLLAAEITSLEGLNNLEQVGGGLDLSVTHNLLSLNALSNLNEIGGYLAITGELLEDLEGLNNIQSLGGLGLIDNSNLQNIDALSNVENILGYINIQRNNSLSNIDGLSSVTLASGFYISDNSSLINIDGLNNLVSVNGSVTINSNPELVNIDGLNNLTSIGEHCFIRNNNKLPNLNGLSNLNYLGDYLDVKGNSVLTDFCGFQPSLISNMQGGYYVSSNAYNPTQQDIIDGNCSQ